MIKILDIQQMRELDAATIAEESIKSEQLMERAAQAVVKAIVRQWSNEHSMVVFAGPGNNGGDALSVARLLSARGYKGEVYLFNTSGKLSHDCELNRKRLHDCQNVELHEITEQFEAPRLTPDKIVIDGLFGTGLSRPLSGGFASLVKFINESPCKVISIDVPSGLLCAPVEQQGDASGIVHAHTTLTFQCPKTGMMLADQSMFWGQVEILDIGLSLRVLEKMPAQHALLGLPDIRELIVPRPAFGHKGTFGNAFIIAGMYGMSGAAVLSARACLRSGVGKVTVHVPQMNNTILQIAVPEAVLSHDPSDTLFTTSVDTRHYDAVAIGPGIGTRPETAVALMEQINRAECPLVLDADAINI